MNTNERKLLHSELSYILQGCFFEIRNQYGPGHKEVVYQRLLAEKLELKGIPFKREERINVYSQDSGKVVGYYQPDILIQDLIIVELKSTMLPARHDEKQLYFYLRNSKYELGYLVNFSTPSLLIKRIIYSNTKKPFLQIRVD